MKRFILTGTESCGKTAILRALEMTGASVVNEAMTDIIDYKQMRGEAEPWKNIRFIDAIVRLQLHRQVDMAGVYSKLHFYDRSPICTYALARYLGMEPTANLLHEIKRIQRHRIYENKVFFIVDSLRPLDNTDAIKMDFVDPIEFERMHLQAYHEFGYECINIVTGTFVDQRVENILGCIDLNDEDE